MGKQGTAVVAGVLGVMTVMFGAASAVLMSQSVVHAHHAYCSASGAMPCGVAATALALTTQIVASAATGCCGSWEIPSDPKRVLALLLSTASWFLAIKALILLTLGTMMALGSLAGDYKIVIGRNCMAVAVGVFTAATILFLVVVVLHITSYILLQAAAAEGSTKPLARPEIPTGMPAVPLNADKLRNASVDDPPPAPTASSEAGAGAPPPARICQV